MIIKHGDESYRVLLVDDGTLDTVLNVTRGDDSIPVLEYRFDSECYAGCRDESGALTDEGFNELAIEAINAFEDELAEQSA